MSLCHQGLDAILTDTTVTVEIPASEPLAALANALDWRAIAALALPDLKRTARGCWYLGRRLSLRSHLAVMILQVLLKETDRGIEQRIRETPVLQVFCGRSVLPDWHCPDHTKIEELRNRLTAPTHKAINDYVVTVAVRFGFADTAWMDVDSTVQEANIGYPADSVLMKQLTEKAHHALEFLKEKGTIKLPRGLAVNIESIRHLARRYFFLAKTAAIEERRALFARYHREVKRELRAVIAFYASLSRRQLRTLPWYIRRALLQVRDHGWRYLLDVGHFVRTHTVKPGKRLSFHAEAIACIKKGKAGKPHEFGRVFQLGRLGGNFLIAFSATSVRMEDKHSLLPAIAEHRALFGDTALEQVGTDKGYYSARNVKAIETLGIDAAGIQRPATLKARPRPAPCRRAAQAPPRRHRALNPARQILRAR